MDPVVGVLDIGMGNVRAIHNAVYEQGVDVVRIKQPSDLDDVTHFIIPGVGSFGYCSDLLRAYGFDTKVSEYIDSGRPLMAICIGMQLLCSSSEESPGKLGLNVFEGHFEHFNKELRVPHMGWNTVDFKFDHPVVEGIKKGADFYCVHSYKLTKSDNILSTTKYGEEYVSSVFRDNVVAFQFHPEKSQKQGLRIIENFCWWDGVC